MTLETDHRVSPTGARRVTQMAHEPLADIAKRLKRLSRDRDLELAREVCKLADNWHMYRAEAGDVPVNTWLRTQIKWTKPLAKYRETVAAAEIVGTAVEKQCETKALLWLAGTSPSREDLERAKSVIAARYFEMKAQADGQPHKLTYEQVRALCPTLIVRQRAKDKRLIDLVAVKEDLRAAKAHIRRLQAQIESAGLVPVE